MVAAGTNYKTNYKMESHIYTVTIAWSKDRRGMMCSPELTQNNALAGGCIEVATPPEFPKGIPGIWSPEHLFTASVSSCFMTTFLAIAENSKLDFVSFRCNSQGKLEKADGKFMMTEVMLYPEVVIADEKDAEKANKVLQKAEANCLISNSIKTKVIMQPTVVTEPVRI